MVSMKTNICISITNSHSAVQRKQSGILLLLLADENINQIFHQ